MPGPYQHPSNIPGAIDRAAAFQNWNGLVFPAGNLLQGGELNELQTIQERQLAAIGNLIAGDGNRVEGADIYVDVEGEILKLAAGRIYARGQVRTVAAATIAEVELAGDVVVGIKLLTTYITAEDEPALLGQVDGTEALGEPGAARRIETASWAIEGDEQPGVFFAVYLVRDGVVIDQTPPPSLDGITKQLAIYDVGAHGSYIVEGCRVTALGVSAGAQVFSIAEGAANIDGYRRTRAAAMRISVEQDFDLEEIDAEPHTLSGSSPYTIPLNHGPADEIIGVTIVKQTTQSVVRGTPNNTSDALAHTGIVSIVSVTQGATTYVAGTDYTLSADRVSWAPGGAEPVGGSSYNVTYRYYDTVAAASSTPDSVTVTGAVTGTTALVHYTRRLPRIDVLGLDRNGMAVYFKGVSKAEGAVAPLVPGNVLPLAEVTNDWRGASAIRNYGIRAIPTHEQWRYFNALFDLFKLVGEERLARKIDSRDPAAKRGIFVDPFLDDSRRDQGEAQTAAVFGGSMQLAIDVTLHSVSIDGPQMLPFVEEVIIEQPFVTACLKINPYMSFTPLPASLVLDPPADIWSESQTQWLSPATRLIAGDTPRVLVRDQLVDEREELLDFLREIEVDFTLRGFGEGEILKRLLFDNIDITPDDPPLVADEDGVITGSFMIPPNVVAGTKLVLARGGSNREAFAYFTGQGTVSVDVMQRTLLVIAPRPRQLPPEPEPVVPDPDPPPAPPTPPDPWIPTGPPRGNTPSGAFGEVYSDPQAQSFAVAEARHILGCDFRPCAIGDRSKPIIVEYRTVDNGYPTMDTRAAVEIPMGPVAVNTWLAARWPAPVFAGDTALRAIVWKTDDPDHAISAAALGGFDTARQQFVTAQPYTVGDRFDGSNGATWVAHPESDITLRVVAAKYTATSRVIELGHYALVDCSDLQIRATVELPTPLCQFWFEVERSSGEIIRLAPHQNHEFASYVTETVELRAVLVGTDKVSPTLYPGIVVASGKLRASGTYVSVAYKAGTGVRLDALFRALLPAGASVTVDHDAADDNWLTVPYETFEAQNDGWIELLYRKPTLTAPLIRLRVTLNGTPAARPAIADLQTSTV